MATSSVSPAQNKGIGKVKGTGIGKKSMVSKQQTIPFPSSARAGPSRGPSLLGSDNIIPPGTETPAWSNKSKSPHTPSSDSDNDHDSDSSDVNPPSRSVLNDKHYFQEKRKRGPGCDDKIWREST